MRTATPLALAAIFLGAAPTVAEPLAWLRSDNGALPPPYRRDLLLTIEADLSVRLRACRGYDEATCEDIAGRTTPEALAAITAVALDLELSGKPLAEEENPPVGGGSASGELRLDGVAIPLPAHVVPEDSLRKSAIVAVLRAAVPAALTAEAERLMNE